MSFIKKPYIIIGILIILAIGSIVFFRLKNNTVPKESIFFVQDGCPHCVKVEEYIKAKEIDKKLVFSTKEIRYNQDNANEFFKIAQQCGIQQQDMGTPMFWDGETCYQGDDEILNFFDKTVK